MERMAKTKEELVTMELEKEVSAVLAVGVFLLLCSMSTTV